MYKRYALATWLNGSLFKAFVQNVCNAGQVQTHKSRYELANHGADLNSHSRLCSRYARATWATCL